MKNKWIFLIFVASLFICGVLNSTPIHAEDNGITTSRLSGSDRYATSVSISQEGWGQADTVIITTGLDYADALSASSLSKLKDAPILLTEKNALRTTTITEIQRLKATQAILVGGTGVIGAGVEKQLKAIGVSFNRIGGVNRYETSKMVAEQIGVNNGVIVATGLDFPDALSIAPIAGIKAMPILLSPKSSLDPNISGFIKGKSIPVSYIVGGTGVLGSAIDSSVPNSKRLAGSDRYETNLTINNEFTESLNFDTVYLATGRDFPDALSGSALAAKNNAPIILTDMNSISPAIIDFIKSKNVKNVVILGGTGVVSTNVEKAFNKPLTFAIDIGHNAKYDTGAVGIKSEDVCTKEVGTRVMAKLTSLGYKVVDVAPVNPTSTTDSLKQRTDKANAANADYYISIHFNIANGTAHGSEIYTNSIDPVDIKTKAQKVLSNLASIGYTSRSIYDNSRGLYVLSHTNMPAMLIECAFLDNVDDMNRYNPDAIANAIVNGLISGN